MRTTPSSDATLLENLTKKQIALGEQILTVYGVVKLGPSPTRLDKILGSSNERSKTIQGVKVSLQDEEYRSLCLEAYKKFIAQHSSKNKFLLHRSLESINKRYNQILAASPNQHEISLSSIAFNLALIGSEITKTVQTIAAKNTTAQESATTDITDAQHITSHNPTTTTATPTTNKAVDISPVKFSLTPVVKTVGDALSWLNARSTSVNGLLFFAASKLTKQPLLRAAVVGSAASEVAAIMVGDQDYPTTVYCGPRMDCDFFKTQATTSNAPYRFSAADPKVAIDPRVARLIVRAHGYNGLSGQFIVAPNQVVMPDEFTHHFFPQVKIIHALGCSIGANLHQNYQRNLLKPTQILFLHSGDEITASYVNVRQMTLLVTEEKPQFPFSLPLAIIYKDSQQQTKIHSIIPPSLETFLESQRNELINNRQQQISTIYDLITDHIASQQSAALATISDPQAKKIAEAELKRVGYQHYQTNQDFAAKEKFVKEFFSQAIILGCNKRMNESELASTKFLIAANLVDTSYRIDDYSIALAASLMNNHEIIAALIAAKTPSQDLLRSENGGATPAYIAAEHNRVKVIELLIQANIPLQSLLVPDYHGVTPILVAAHRGNVEIIETFIKAGASIESLTMVNRHKLSPIHAAVVMLDQATDVTKKSNYKKIIKLLTENGVEMISDDILLEAYPRAFIELHDDKTPDTKPKNPAIKIDDRQQEL